MEGKKCSCQGGTVIVYSCSGNANLGQACNELAQRLMERGVGRMGCLAGVGGHLPNMVMSAQSADEVIVLDGCQMGCALRIIEQAGAKASIHLVATEIGLAKKNGKRYTEDEVKVLDDELTKLRFARNGFVRIE
jgi:uncharacterized metal-binding protein